MSFSSRILSQKSVHLLTRTCRSCIAKRWKSTINIDQSLEQGSLIPNISVADAGISTLIGQRRYQEDRYSIEIFQDGTLYLAIFDGHGGSLAADYAVTHMPKLLESTLLKDSTGVMNSFEKSFIGASTRLLEYIRKNKDGRQLSE